MASTQVLLRFIYNSDIVNIQCTKGEYMKDIFKKFLIKYQVDLKNVYYLCNGSIIDGNLKLEQINNKDTELKILVQSFDDNIQNGENQIKYSREIICPECKEICMMNIKNYRINLFRCKNGHNINNILFEDFQKTQEISEYKIICNECNKNTKAETHKNTFYKCCKCQKVLCPLCQNQKHKDHIIIDYDYKEYICNFHGEKYSYYCKECNMNLCDLCEHNNKHEIIHLKKIVYNKNKILETNSKLKDKIDILKTRIKEMIRKLNKFMNDLETYYYITNKAINNYDIRYKNFEVLVNMENINSFDNNIINDIDKILKENNEGVQIKYIKNLYDRINMNQMTIEYKNDSKLEQIKIFEDFFVKNNISNYEMIINNKKYKLNSFINPKLLGINEDKFEIILREINPSNNLSGMFHDCSSLLSIKDISKFNLDNIIIINSMFSGCSSLQSLPDISSWNTNKIIDMSFLFNECISLQSLPDISNWITYNVKNMSGLFRNCCSLSSLPDIPKWDTFNVSNMSLIFNKCSNLKSLPDISKWNLDKTNDMKYMFGECYSLQSLPDLSKWNTSNVQIIFGIFFKCSSLISLPDISKWNINNINNLFAIFSQCSSLYSLPDISKWNTDNVINISSLFEGCSSLKSLPNLSKWNVENVTDMKGLFNKCLKLECIPDISNWNTEKVLDISYMFNECISLKSLPDLSKWNLRNVVKSEYIFDECKSLNSIPNINAGSGCVGQ